MANTENINVTMNEEVFDAAVQAAEAIPVKPDSKFGVIGGVVLVGGLIIGGIALGIRHIKNKKKAKEEAATDAEYADVTDTDDFEEVDSTEE
jgi:hypothetical protein